MKKLDQRGFVIPLVIILGFLILGGFYYAVQVSKQHSIEKQTELPVKKDNANIEGKNVSSNNSVSVNKKPSAPIVVQQETQSSFDTTITPEEQEWINKGWVTISEVNSINSGDIEANQFVAVINRIKEGYKKEYPSLIHRDILIKYLFHPPLTQQELSKLPSDIQNLVEEYGEKDPNVIQLQIRALNDQILNYDFTMDQKFQTIINNYLTQQGLPITQPVPIKANCTFSNSGLSPTVNCYIQ